MNNDQKTIEATEIPNITKPSAPTQKNVKDMTLEEQVAYYKSIFQKSKKLNLYYEDENKKLKERLIQYESGKLIFNQIRRWKGM